MSPYLRHRLFALVSLVVVGGPAFLVAGTYWETPVGEAAALARFRAAGSAAAEAAPGLPIPGVYRYATTGGEKISFLDYRREYSPVTLRVVTRRGCGVREEQAFLAQHVEYYDRCGSALPTYGTDIAFWWTHGNQDFVCGVGSFDGGDLAVGEKSEWDCSDEDTTAHQLVEYLGEEVVHVQIDGSSGESAPITARHTRWTTKFSGATTGTAVVDDWFQVGTGLVLKEARAIGLRVGSPFVGHLTYVDVSDYLLMSTTPRR